MSYSLFPVQVFGLRDQIFIQSYNNTMLADSLLGPVSISKPIFLGNENIILIVKW